MPIEFISTRSTSNGAWAMVQMRSICKNTHSIESNSPLVILIIPSIVVFCMQRLFFLISAEAWNRHEIPFEYWRSWWLVTQNKGQLWKTFNFISSMHSYCSFLLGSDTERNMRARTILHLSCVLFRLRFSLFLVIGYRRRRRRRYRRTRGFLSSVRRSWCSSSTPTNCVLVKWGKYARQ